jgi:hypothetical protein
MKLLICSFIWGIVLAICMQTLGYSNFFATWEYWVMLITVCTEFTILSGGLKC